MPVRSIATLNAAGRIIQITTKNVPDGQPSHEAFPGTDPWIEVQVNAGTADAHILCMTKVWRGGKLVDLPPHELNEHEAAHLKRLRSHPKPPPGGHVPIRQAAPAPPE